MPKLAPRERGGEPTFDPRIDALIAAVEHLCKAVEDLQDKFDKLKDWVETAVNRPWELANGAPPGRSDDEIPY